MKLRTPGCELWKAIRTPTNNSEMACSASDVQSRDLSLGSEKLGCGSAHAMAEVARRNLARLRRQVDSWFTADGNNTDYDPLLEVSRTSFERLNAFSTLLGDRSGAEAAGLNEIEQHTLVKALLLGEAISGRRCA